MCAHEAGWCHHNPLQTDFAIRMWQRLTWPGRDGYWQRPETASPSLGGALVFVSPFFGQSGQVAHDFIRPRLCMGIRVENTENAVFTFLKLSPDIDESRIFMRSALSALPVRLRQFIREAVRRKAQVNVHQVDVECELGLRIRYVTPEIAR